METHYQQLIGEVLDKYFGGLNQSQRRAVLRINGPLLILAGAGSGKTTVLVRRIENMILFGDAYAKNQPAGSPQAEQVLQAYLSGEEIDPQQLSQAMGVDRVPPWKILAITFTNKAAGELRDRLAKLLGEGVGADVPASTFHSLCARILRREGERLGYGRSFTIYDTDDSIRVIKNCLKRLDIDDKLFPAKSVLGAIGRAKDSLLSPDELSKAAGDYRENKIAEIYDVYARELKAANAMDFDDLIYQTVRLLTENPDLRDEYRRRYPYIMVDEYQDTSHAQYMLITQLVGSANNLCVVGDDDQSIYKFRGATIENILSFERQFPGAQVIRLEENYRSTSHILDAANSVIANNTERKGKNLWTQAGEGEKVAIERLRGEEDESRLIANAILENVKNGAKFSEHAILYRMNALSNSLEQALARSAIPYRIIGGLRFYERKEIKDMTAYLTVLDNPSDNLRLTRIINEPKRGIGPTTVAAALEIAAGLGLSLFEILTQCDQFEVLAKKRTPILEFTAMIGELSELADNGPLDVLLEELLVRTGYRAMLESQGFEGAGRLENILELKSNLIRYEQEADEPSLPGFLEEIALYTDLDNYSPDADALVLMTIHAAKGLEFDHVFIAGMDEGVFPGRSVAVNPAEVEEERRLAYVAITRARKRLVITTTQRRMLFGQTFYATPSRFIGEIPQTCAELTDHTIRTTPKREAPPIKKRITDSSTSIGVGGGQREKSQAVSYYPGDRVEHKVFGQGEVLSAKPMGGDALLEIRFDSGQTKKIMANFAHLSKI
ncbi:MAG: UvrD-helicase domain-containing protein [Oscillospiraceae bacterium]|nr:UvrD-helicase domain-containing protein [Oscillospiraceae bacterium]